MTAETTMMSNQTEFIRFAVAIVMSTSKTPRIVRMRLISAQYSVEIGVSSCPSLVGIVIVATGEVVVNVVVAGVVVGNVVVVGDVVVVVVVVVVGVVVVGDVVVVVATVVVGVVVVTIVVVVVGVVVIGVVGTIVGRVELVVGMAAQFAETMTLFAGMVKVVVALLELARIAPPAVTVQPLKTYPERVPAFMVTVTPAV